MARTEQVVVIGAGMGGLACAIDLAVAGFEVTLCERAATVGGKMRQIALGAARVDAGPTVFTMRWVFDTLFEAAGQRLDDHLTARPAALLARHAWDATQRLDLFADLDRSADAIGDFAGAREAAGFRAFSAEAKRVYETLRAPFLAAPKTGPVGLSRRIGLARLGDLTAIRPFETLWGALGDHFSDPRLRQLFGRYATYCGSSPFAAPATLMLIAHVERDGVWLIEGGMQRLADALAALAISLGVCFRLGAEVRSIEVASGRAAGVTLADGERLPADRVVANLEPSAIAGGALGAAAAGATAAVPVSRRSLSAVTWAMVAPTSGFDLAHHTVFFSNDYRAEFDDLFAQRRTPRAPTVYVCAQDRGDGGGATGGPERLLVLVNAPANGDQGGPPKEELIACETRAFDHLRRCGLSVARDPAALAMTTPATFESLFPGSGGALYGRATHGWAAAFQRPGASTRLPGFYLAGGSAHPGAGAPMAALSGRSAAVRIMADRASTLPWRRGATPGGTSTP